MEPTPDYDSPWKEILDAYFEDFMRFFFSPAHAAIDWSRQPEFLDKELQKITADAELGRRHADKLVKVWLKNGEEICVLIHVEVQGDRETGFELRIYVYNHRIFERYNTPVASFVILTDDDPNWRPSEYRQQVFGTQTSFQFEAAKLLDYEARWAELEADANVFAVVTMAHLRVISTRRDIGARMNWKLQLTKLLYERGYDKLTVLKLFKFLDWLVWLPKELQKKYEGDLICYEEEKRMPYVTSIELRGIEKGIEKGMEKGRVEGATNLTLRQLRRRFGTLAEETQTRIQTLPLNSLEELGEALLDFSSVNDLQAWLDTHPGRLN